jgi:hypothetical protein
MAMDATLTRHSAVLDNAEAMSAEGHLRAEMSGNKLRHSAANGVADSV